MKIHWPEGVTPASFLRDYWQKKPLLIRNAFVSANALITPEELAGLACEAEIESRLIIEDVAQEKWSLQHGPLEEAIFSTLPESHWTILVQDVDNLCDPLMELLSAIS